MKEIKCRRCGKVVVVEDDYQLKTCEICHALDLKDSALRSANSERDRETEKLIKRLGIEKLPQALESYVNFCEWFESREMPKPSFELYMQELTKYRKMEIQRQTDNQVSTIKSEKAKRIAYYSRFLRFDIFGFSNREHCRIYRLSVMDCKTDIRLTQHLEECENCQDWQYSFNETDAFTHNRLLVDLDGHPFCQNEQCIICGTKLVYGECPTCQQILNEDKFEQWENNKGLKDLPKELIKHLSSEYAQDKPNNPE